MDEGTWTQTSGSALQAVPTQGSFEDVDAADSADEEMTARRGSFLSFARPSALFVRSTERPRIME